MRSFPCRLLGSLPSVRFPTGLFLFEFRAVSIGALVIRIGFWGSVYYSYNKEPPQNNIGKYVGPYIKLVKLCLRSGPTCKHRQRVVVSQHPSSRSVCAAFSMPQDRNGKTLNT